jgi:hypothetical protein
MGEAVAEPADEEQGRYFEGGSDTEGDAGPHHIEPQGLGDVDSHDRHRGGVGGLQQDERRRDQHDTESADGW